MQTYFEIISEKSFVELTLPEKEAVQTRQTELAVMWQDATSDIEKELVFDELYASLKGLVSSMAYKQAEKSFSVDKDDFEGIMNLVLVETLIKFDRTLNKPFQPIFIYNVNNEIRMMYRQKSYDVHDTATREEDKPQEEVLRSTTLPETPFSDVIENNVMVEQAIENAFGKDDVKRTIVHMSLQQFKRNEIVSAIGLGRSTDAVAKQINRTMKQFKETFNAMIQTTAH